MTDNPKSGGGPLTSASSAAAREIEFHLGERRFAFSAPPPGDGAVDSVFLVGLPKAGSTLLNRLMRPVVTASGLSFVGLQEIMYGMGVAAQDIPAEVNQAFQPKGYAFGAFRSLPGGLRLPQYATDRTVLLVRDPRDMLTSLYFSLARSHRPPGRAVGGALAETFEEQRQEVNRTSIDSFVLERAAIVAGQYRTVEAKLARIAHRLYRYEDIIFDKLSWSRDMTAYLGLTVAPDTLEQIVQANDVRPEVEDPAQHVRKVVPGDHREKLTSATIAELNLRLEPILRRYRYL